jgi:uncharacterized membrane protein
VRLRPDRERRTTVLAAPRRPARLQLQPHYDPDAFGRFSEAIARLLGTARFLVVQTVVVVTWITWNVVFRGTSLAFDPYPFILLTLALSLQASYAAPLILLAQNRQAERDRQEAESDRRTSMRLQADTEYLARELAAIRLALGEMPTRDYMSEELTRLEDQIHTLGERLRVDGEKGGGRGGTADGSGGARLGPKA